MKILTTAQFNQLLENAKQQERVRETGTEIDFQPVVKLYVPGQAAKWLLTKIDPDMPDIAFGLCDIGVGSPELGSVSLSELESLTRSNGAPVVVCDTAFQPTKTISEYAADARKKGYITV